MKGRGLLFALLLVLAVHFSWGFERTSYCTNRCAVKMDGGNEIASSVAESHGMRNLGLIANLKDMYLLQMDQEREVYAANSREWSTMTNALEGDEHVTYVEAECKTLMEKYFYTQPTDPLWNDQWFILNTGQLGAPFAQNDVNAERVWIQGITGCNVTVAVVDTGVQYTHSDLSFNYDPNLSYDICEDDNDPFPDVLETHGTAVAGEIASVKSNTDCGTGVAYNAIFGSIRLIACLISDIDIANALTYKNDIIQIYSNSWGPIDNGALVLGPGPMLQMVLQTAVEEVIAYKGRDGKGSVIVFASGNGGEVDDCSANGYCTNINTIAIGSASVDGTQASYDETCPCKMAVNFVSGTSSLSVATTTVGGCTLTFDGTSASCPVASAVIALALEVNPDLTWRDVQYLVAYTSSHQQLTGGSPSTNGGGLEVSHEFGFGAMNAEALVSRARHWITVPPQHFSDITTTPSSGNAVFNMPLVITFMYSGSIVFLEHVVAKMTVGVTTGMRGDLRIELTSPFGTTSTLVDYRDNDSAAGEYIDWGFMSVHFWEENPSGQWTLTVMSRSASSPVHMFGLVVTLYGTDEVPEAIANIPQQCDPACAGGCAGAGPEFCDACANLRDAHTRECITSCPIGYEERNGYCYNSAIPEPVCRSEAPEIEGSCVAAGFTDCCEGGNCQGTPGPSTCYCDAICHTFGDCCDDIDETCPAVSVTFTQESYIVGEAVAAQSLKLSVCVVADTNGRSFSVTLIPISGTAVANADFAGDPILIEFQKGGSTEQCGCIEIIDDTVKEDTESFLIGLSVPTGVTIEGSNLVTVEIEDDEEDTRLMFINDTPRVTANSITAEFVVGASFVFVSCQLNTQEEKYCSEGSVTFDGLEPDRRSGYTLTITGSLPNGNVVILKRRFHVGTICDCWAHLINDGITVDGDSVTIEWQGTGPGANFSPPLPFQCSLRGVTTYQECSSPHVISGLSSGGYTIDIQHDDPHRLVCIKKNKASFHFHIN